jgi:hypothetical protein
LSICEFQIEIRRIAELLFGNNRTLQVAHRNVCAIELNRVECGLTLEFEVNAHLSTTNEPHRHTKSQRFTFVVLLATRLLPKFDRLSRQTHHLRSAHAIELVIVRAQPMKLPLALAPARARSWARSAAQQR